MTDDLDPAAWVAQGRDLGKPLKRQRRVHATCLDCGIDLLTPAAAEQHRTATIVQFATPAANGAVGGGHATRSDAMRRRSPSTDAAARLPVALAALAAVLALHRPQRHGDEDWCADCDRDYPCATVRAITAAIQRGRA